MDALDVSATFMTITLNFVFFFSSYNDESDLGTYLCQNYPDLKPGAKSYHLRFAQARVSNQCMSWHR